MKKVLLVISLIVVILLTGCTNKDDVQNDNNGEVMSGDVKQAEITEEDRSTVATYVENISIWEDSENMLLGSGIYSTGYTFFDIDNDGTKELAVQYGGGTLHNCNTRFYRLKDGNLEEYPEVQEGLSLSVNDLKKYVDSENNEKYINEYVLKVSPVQYMKFIDEVSVDDGTIIVEPLFMEKEMFTEDGQSSTEYFVIENSVEESINNPIEESVYNQKLQEFYDRHNEIMINTEFINYTDWENMNNEEKTQALLSSYVAK